jgi:hypothetical protein
MCIFVYSKLTLAPPTGTGCIRTSTGGSTAGAAGDICSRKADQVSGEGSAAAGADDKVGARGSYTREPGSWLGESLRQYYVWAGALCKYTFLGWQRVVVAHSVDSILLEKTAFLEEAVEDENKKELHPLDQAIILAFCLDVADNNPKDGLTSEQVSKLGCLVASGHINPWLCSPSIFS